MEKEAEYRALCSDVAAYYRTPRIYSSGKKSISLGWCPDCREINLWTYWQGRGHLNPRVLLVGQDWGAPSDDPAIMEKIRQMNQGAHILYMDHHTASPTDTNLIELFSQIGYQIDTDDPHNHDLFFTNLIPGYRNHGFSGGYQAGWLTPEIQDFFHRLVGILQPEVILCLGRTTFEGVMRSLDIVYDRYRSFNQQIASGAVHTQFCHLPLAIFPLAHCGAMGTLNRNRGSKEPSVSQDLLCLQKRDWDRIRRSL